MPGRLVVVATPIGNLDDLSPRAAEILRSADVVAAEDTRRTGRLLARVGADTPQVSYHEHNEAERTPVLVERMRAGETVALVTDAGTPGISDPGFRLVRACVEAGLTVEAVPGPSAALHALVVSGLPADRFAFEGFLPRRGRQRRERLEALAREERTMVLFVAPHRAGDDLADLAGALGEDRPAAVARELTKLHEEVVRGTLGELAGGAGAGGYRGELTVVVAGTAPPTPSRRPPEDLAADVSRRVAAGVPKKEAIAEVADEAGVPKREVYQAVVDSGS
jgi:16S rRNA (cytidine1402-2'-O)-methyltransferase